MGTLTVNDGMLNRVPKVEHPPHKARKKGESMRHFKGRPPWQHYRYHALPGGLRTFTVTRQVPTLRRSKYNPTNRGLRIEHFVVQAVSGAEASAYADEQQAGIFERLGWSSDDR